MKIKQSGASVVLNKNLINSKVAKKLLLVLLASSSIAYAAKPTCPLSKADIKDKIRSSPVHSITLNYSIDQKDTAQACKDSILLMAKKRSRKVITVIVPESPVSGKDKLQVVSNPS